MCVVDVGAVGAVVVVLGQSGNTRTVEMGSVTDCPNWSSSTRIHVQ